MDIRARGDGALTKITRDPLTHMRATQPPRSPASTQLEQDAGNPGATSKRSCERDVTSGLREWVTLALVKTPVPHQRGTIAAPHRA